MVPLVRLPGAGLARGRAMLTGRGPIARLVFSVAVPSSSFFVYLTGAKAGDSPIAFHRRGATLSATLYLVSTLADYRWLTIYGTGHHGGRGQALLRLSLRALAQTDGLRLPAPSPAHAKGHRKQGR